MNCNNSLDAYDTIIACGIKDAATSTISKLLNREVTPAMAAEIIQKRLVEIEKVSN
jgi:lipoyl(octanoyl) transferase